MSGMATISASWKMGQGEPGLEHRRPAAPVVPRRLARAHTDEGPMRTVLISNDPVRLSFLTALLADAGIGSIVLDAYVSAVEGSIGAFPRRLAVLPEDEAQAHRVLREANEA